MLSEYTKCGDFVTGISHFSLCFVLKYQILVFRARYNFHFLTKISSQINSTQMLELSNLIQNIFSDSWENLLI